MEHILKTNDVSKRFREYIFTGDISVQNIDTIMDEMRECVRECDDLVISLNNITGFDVAAFQLFCSIKNSFVRDKKSLKVTCQLSPQIKQLLENCGITNLAQTLSIPKVGA